MTPLMRGRPGFGLLTGRLRASSPSLPPTELLKIAEFSGRCLHGLKQCGHAVGLDDALAIVQNVTADVHTEDVEGAGPHRYRRIIFGQNSGPPSGRMVTSGFGQTCV